MKWSNFFFANNCFPLASNHFHIETSSYNTLKPCLRVLMIKHDQAIDGDDIALNKLKRIKNVFFSPDLASKNGGNSQS